MHGRVATTLVVFLTSVGLSAPAAAEVTPVEVLATSKWEANPAASADLLAWERSQTWPQVFAQTTGGSAFQVNRDNTVSSLGGIDGATLVYAQSRYIDNPWDIYVYDLAAHTRSQLPKPVNTRRGYETAGSVSGGWLLFDRWTPERSSVFLYNMTTHELRRLHAGPAQRTLAAEQVTGNYAVFTRYVYEPETPSCTVYLHDITAQTTTKIPNPDSRCQYAPSVDPAGTVYFASSGRRDCAKSSLLQMVPLGGAATTLVDFADFSQPEQSYAVDNGDGTTDVYFDQQTCNAHSDIMKVSV